MFFVFMLRNKERQFYLWKSMNKKKKDRILIFLKHVILKMHILEQWVLQANILVWNLQPIFKQPQSMSEHIPRHALKPDDLNVLWKYRSGKENATRTETFLLLFYHRKVSSKRQQYVQNTLQWFHSSIKTTIMSLQTAQKVVSNRGKKKKEQCWNSSSTPIYCLLFVIMSKTGNNKTSTKLQLSLIAMTSMFIHRINCDQCKTLVWRSAWILELDYKAKA